MASPTSSIDPSAFSLKAWKCMVAAVIMVQAIGIPYQLAFGFEPPTWLYLCNKALLVLLAQILVQSKTAFYQDGKLLDDPLEVRSHWVSSSLGFQLIITFPFDLLLSSLGWPLPQLQLHLLWVPSLFRLFPCGTSSSRRRSRSPSFNTPPPAFWFLTDRMQLVNGSRLRCRRRPLDRLQQIPTGPSPPSPPLATVTSPTTPTSATSSPSSLKSWGGHVRFHHR